MTLTNLFRKGIDWLEKTYETSLIYYLLNKLDNFGKNITSEN